MDLRILAALGGASQANGEALEPIHASLDNLNQLEQKRVVLEAERERRMGEIQTVYDEFAEPCRWIAAMISTRVQHDDLEGVSEVAIGPLLTQQGNRSFVEFPESK